MELLYYLFQDSIFISGSCNSIILVNTVFMYVLLFPKEINEKGGGGFLIAERKIVDAS